MAEFQEVMKINQRMCESYVGCVDCYLSNTNNGENIGCGQFCVKNPRKAEEIIMKWAEEHPVQTNADKFKEVFGMTLSFQHCPKEYCKNCNICDGKFWKEEYKEPKE